MDQKQMKWTIRDELDLERARADWLEEELDKSKARILRLEAGVKRSEFDQEAK